jgi:hypothetical protein
VPIWEALGYVVWAASRDASPVIETFHVKRDTGHQGDRGGRTLTMSAFPEAGSDQQTNDGGLGEAAILEMV